MTDLAVNINKTINAPIEKVFDAWLDPKMLAKFILPMPGMSEPDVENNASIGGKFSIIMKVGDDKLPHTGEYQEISRPDKLVFTWVSHCSVDNSTVTINFTSIDKNTTALELTHLKFINEETRLDHQGGWGNILDKLAEILIEPALTA